MNPIGYGNYSKYDVPTIANGKEFLPTNSSEVALAATSSPDLGRGADFNDVLRGGFGTPDEGFTIRWKAI